MQLVRRQFLRFAGSALVSSTLPSMARAQAYPARPIRLIVPYAAGGPNDAIARMIGQKLSKAWGQQFYVENIPIGAGVVLSARRIRLIGERWLADHLQRVRSKRHWRIESASLLASLSQFELPNGEGIYL